MIDKKDLRVGNIYNRKHGKGWTLTVMDEYIIGEIFSPNLKYALNDFEPIPLTPEWLKQCGFEKNGFTWSLDKLSICMPGDAGYENGRLYFNAWFIIEPPKYLHTLMNIYYALTNTEITIQL